MSTATINGVTFTADAFAAPSARRDWSLPAWLVYAGMLIFVGLVSLYDGYLVIRTGDMIRDFEQNPVGLYLINADHGDSTLFLITKGAGTLLVLISLTVLYRRWKPVAFPVAFAILLFQAGLLIFLEQN